MNLLLKLVLYAYAIKMVISDILVFKIFLILLSIYLVIYIYLGKHPFNGFRRKMQLSTWDESKCAAAYASVEIDITELEEKINIFNKKNSQNLTISHICLKILAELFKKTPSVNGRIMFGRFIPFDGVHITTLVDANGKNLSNVLIRDCDKKNFIQIKESLNPTVKAIKKDEYVPEKNRINLFKSVPYFIFDILFDIFNSLSVLVGFSNETLDIKKDICGICLFTNVSKLKIKNGYGTLCHNIKIGLVVALCEPELKPKVINNEIKIRKVSNLNITFDHRLGDGSIAYGIMSEFENLNLNIDKYFKECEEYIKERKI